MSVKEKVFREIDSLYSHNTAIAEHEKAINHHQQAATQCIERIGKSLQTSPQGIFNAAFDALNNAANLNQSNKLSPYRDVTPSESTGIALDSLNNLNADNRQFIQKENILSKQPLHNIAITAYNSSVQCFENLETFKKFNSSK